MFSAWELLVEKSLTPPKVLDRALTPLGQWKVIFKVLMRPRCLI